MFGIEWQRVAKREEREAWKEPEFQFPQFHDRLGWKLLTESKMRTFEVSVG